MSLKLYPEARWTLRLAALVLLLLATLHPAVADDEHAETNRRGRNIDLDDYRAARDFNLPAPAGPADVLSDGRIIVLAQTTVFRETAPRSRHFVALGTLPDADFSSFGASFLRVSPDGDRIAVGNNGGASFSNFQVGVFNLPSLTGTWYAANSFQAAWINDRFLALTAGEFGSPGIVTAFDTLSPDPAHPSNRVIIDNIGGAPGGVAFDRAGNLYTANGFAIAGPSATGDVKAFRRSAWLAAFHGGSPVDFEARGVLVVSLLSGTSLDFDRGGNLSVGGGDFFGGGDIDFAALVSDAAVRSALTGHGPADPRNPREVRELDPDPAAQSAYNIIINRKLDEIYFRSSGELTFTFRAR